MVREKFYSVEDMYDWEDLLAKSKLYSLELKADQKEDLLKKLHLKVEYTDNLPEDVEAELLSIEDSQFYGLIKLNADSKNKKFAFIPEIIQYIFEVGYEKKVTKSFVRKKIKI